MLSSEGSHKAIPQRQAWQPGDGGAHQARGLHYTAQNPVASLVNSYVCLKAHFNAVSRRKPSHGLPFLHPPPQHFAQTHWGGSRNVAPNNVLPKPRQPRVTHPLAFQGVTLTVENNKQTAKLEARILFITNHHLAIHSDHVVTAGPQQAGRRAH